MREKDKVRVPADIGIRLATGIAHDIDSILSTMMGIAQVLETQEETTPQAKESLGELIAQGQRGARLIRQVLDFSRTTMVQRQTMGLTTFLKESIKLLQRSLPENIRIFSEVEDREFRVSGNPTQLQQVISNLAANARDAMSQGGQLRIGLSRLLLQEKESPPLPGMQPGDWTVWTITDTGSGMSPEVREHIFEPFFTTRVRKEGTGLGLAQVYGIVKQHEGEIGVESRVGEGTCFTIYLPEMSGGKAVAKRLKESLPRGDGETILVVEDNPRVLTVVRKLLRSLNYRVLTAENGREAIELFDEHEEVALVLTDMVMPEMGGFELLRALRKKRRDVRLVVMTGYARAIKEGDPRLKEIDGLLEKPVGLERVAKMLSGVLERSS